LLTLHVTVVQARRWRSKPDRGLLHSPIELFNQRGELVMTMKPMKLMRTRSAEPD
jgi:hypothetical protein